MRTVEVAKSVIIRRRSRAREREERSFDDALHGLVLDFLAGRDALNSCTDY